VKKEGHHGGFWLRRALLAAVCVVGISLSGCGGPVVVARETPPTQPLASATSSPSPGNVQAGDQQNGQTISLREGETLTVVLSTTFWSFQGSSDVHVLTQVGAAVASPGPFNQQTCPYGGCGTVTAVFRAVGLGTAQVSASRVSCGEAMRCVGTEALYQVTVVVAPAAQ
jgi:hypothetical protein